MTTSNDNASRAATLLAGRVMCADSLGHTLLTMATPPEHRRADAVSRVPILGRHGELPEALRRVALAADMFTDALPVTRIEQVDAEAVAQWIVDHHQHGTYPTVILGSPHGAAVHLAATCGAAWLPTSFTITTAWPGGNPGNWMAAMAWGTRLAQQIIDHNPSVTVRQVHDPVLRGPLAGTTVSLHVRWRTLPEAYRTFLTSRITAGGTCLLARDLRTWPVLGGPPGYSFQIGSPAGGWAPTDYRGDNDGFGHLLHQIGTGDWIDPPGDMPTHYAENSGEPALEPQLRQHAANNGFAAPRLLYADPQAFSAAVADLIRDWLPHRDGGSHAVVSSGRMLDPWTALDAGMVPYWCESSTPTAVEAAELWLAGSEPYDRICVLPEPPGTPHDRIASLAQWRSVTAFARRAGMVDNLLARRYPTLPAAVGHATGFIRNAAVPRPRPQSLPADVAVRRLAEHGSVRGLMVT